MMSEHLTKEGHSNTRSNLGVLKHLHGDLEKSEKVMIKVQSKMDQKGTDDEVKYNLAILKELGFTNKQ